jgi:eukaryotic-like serine/threonine-protein kinase
MDMLGNLPKIGKYEVLDVIGRGGMGVVYKATDPHIGRFVAIKMITGGDLERFYVEAKSTGKLQCPNIVTVYDMGDQDGNPYLVMEYLEGVSLESILASGRPMSLLEKLRVMIDVCNGLSYAHQRNVIHRDIKPGNIMVLNDGTAKIVDFGIARVGDRRMTKTDQVIGSLHYMSPEQIQDRPLDAGSDIFSTGVVLYQLLTGALPFESSEAAATLMKIIHEPPSPLDNYIRDYPPELDQVISRSMAKNRDERYASARDLAFDLTRIVEQQREQVVAAFLKRAETAMQRAEWIKAREQLQQILGIDRQHAEARRLLGEVQERIRKQQRSEQARQLRRQADEAFVDLRYDEALRLLDQALVLDEANRDISEFRVLVQAAKEQTARFQMSLRRAEAAHSVGDLAEAQQAVAEALALNPNETQAKVLQHVIAKQLEEQARQAQMRKLLDEAHNLLAGRKITQAFAVLKSAESLDPNALELQSLLKLAHAALEQESRKADLEKHAHLIEEALVREDYAAASSQAEAGLKKYPRDQGLLRLKTFADTEWKRVEEKAFVREQFASANALLDSGRTLEALSTVEKAMQRVPSESQLESLRSVIKERLTQEESEDHLRQLFEAARRSVAAGDYDDAVRTLESARQEFSGSRDVDELLSTAKTLLARERSVELVLVSAQQLLGNKQALRAVQLLEGAVQQQSDHRLLNCLTDARRQLDQFQRGLEHATSEGERILQEHGSEEAAAFLDAQARSYADAPHFQDLMERVRRRGVAEVLDRQLAEESTPETRVRLAEAALRKNPGNEEIEKRLAVVRERKNQITAVVEKARDLEFSRQYKDAAENLSTLRKLYPEYLHLEAEILRLTKLDDQQKLLSQQASNAAPEETVETVLEQPPAEILGATAIVSVRLEPLSSQTVARGEETTAQAHPPASGWNAPAGGESRTFPRSAGVLAGAAVVAVTALLGITFLHFRHPPTISVKSTSLGSQNKPALSLNPSSTAAPNTSLETKETVQDPSASGIAVQAAQRDKMVPSPHQNSSASQSAKSQPRSAFSASPVPDAIGSVSHPDQDRNVPSSATTIPDKTVAKGDPGTQETAIVASNQPPSVPPAQPHLESNPSPSIPPPEVVVPAPKAEPESLSKPTPESDAVRSALLSYEDAYGSMDIGELQRVWPSLSKDQMKKLKEGFRGAQAVKVNLKDCSVPALSGDTAQVSCSQSMVYTRDGRRQPAQTVSVAILLKRAANGNWLVDKVQY